MRRDMRENQIRRVIRYILEDLGKFNPKAGRGWGTGQGSITQSTKPMLGYVENKTEDVEDEKRPVKVSRAFFDTDDDPSHK